MPFNGAGNHKQGSFKQGMHYGKEQSGQHSQFGTYGNTRYNVPQLGHGGVGKQFLGIVLLDGPKSSQHSRDTAHPGNNFAEPKALRNLVHHSYQHDNHSVNTHFGESPGKHTGVSHRRIAISIGCPYMQRHHSRFHGKCHQKQDWNGNLHPQVHIGIKVNHLADTKGSGHVMHNHNGHQHSISTNGAKHKVFDTDALNIFSAVKGHQIRRPGHNFPENEERNQVNAQQDAHHSHNAEDEVKVEITPAFFSFHKSDGINGGHRSQPKNYQRKEPAEMVQTPGKFNSAQNQTGRIGYMNITEKQPGRNQHGNQEEQVL